MRFLLYMFCNRWPQIRLVFKIWLFKGGYQGNGYNKCNGFSIESFQSLYLSSKLTAPVVLFGSCINVTTIENALSDLSQNISLLLIWWKHMSFFMMSFFSFDRIRMSTKTSLVVTIGHWEWSHHDTNFVTTWGTAGFLYDNLQYCQRR